MIGGVGIIVNDKGHILVQLRDNNTDICPNALALIGGAIENYDDTHADCVIREAYEEAAIKVIILTKIHEGKNPYNSAYDHYHVAFTHAHDDDIVIGEGRDIKFMSLDDILASKMVSHHKEALEAAIPFLEHFTKIALSDEPLFDYRTHPTYE